MLREFFEKESALRTNLDRESLREIIRSDSLLQTGLNRGDGARGLAQLPDLDLLSGDTAVCCERGRRLRSSREVQLTGDVVTVRENVRTTERSDGSIVITENDRLRSVTYPDGRRRDFGYSDKSDSPTKITLTFPGGVDRIVWTRDKNVWKSDTGQQFESEDSTTPLGDYKYKDSKGAVTLIKADGSRVEWSATGNLSDVNYADGRQSKLEWDGGKLIKVALRDGSRLVREGDDWKVVVPPPGMAAGVQKLTISCNRQGEIRIKDALNNDHIYKVNGDFEVAHSSGTSDIIRLNGSRVIEKDPETKAKLVRHHGGNLADIDDDGKLVCLRTSDGTWRKRDNSWFFKKTGEAREVQFKGSLECDADGNCRVVQEDGIRRTFRCDGSRLKEFPSGKVQSECRQRDGCVVAVLRDGRQEHTMPDGSRIELDRKGRVTAVADDNGKTWNVAFDSTGRLKSIKADGHTWVRPPGHSHWKNEKGERKETCSIIPIEQLAAVFVTNPGALLEFRRNCATLDQRLKTNPVTNSRAAEIKRDVNQQVARLLVCGDRERSKDADGERVLPRVSRDDRVLLARQVMHHAAHPYRTDQGYHGTCSVSTVETRLYTRKPEFVARLIADVALTGSYKAGDKSVYHFPANDPTFKKDGDGLTRTLASQLFVATAVNVFWSNQERDPSGKPIEKGTLRYEQRRIDRGKKDGGECLIDTKTGKRVEDWSAINISRVVEMSRRLTGQDERFAITHATRGKYDDVIAVTSKEELRNNLIKMKADKLLPASTSVNTGSRFFGDQPATPTMHAVSIVDFDEKTNTVMVDNQWGDEADHLGLPGTSRRLTLDEFYQATIWKEPSPEKKPAVKDR